MRRRRAARGGEVEALEIEIEFYQRLAGQIGRGPAVERAVAERTADAVDHQHRAVEPDLGFGRKRSLQQAGRLQSERDRKGLPLAGNGGRGGIEFEGQRMLAGFGGAGDAHLAVGIDFHPGVDAVDAVSDAVAQIGKFHRAAAHRDAIDGGAGRIRLTARGRELPGRRRRRTDAFAQQRHMQHRACHHEVGHQGMARPHAGERDVGLQIGDGDAPGTVAVGGVLQGDVGQTHVQRRPQPDPGRAGDVEPIAGVALHPRNDRRGQQSRGDSDDRQQRQHGDDGRDRAAGDFQNSHGDVPDPADPGELIPERANRPKGSCKAM